MKKSISLLFALACAFSLSAKTIYLVPDMWKTADAKFSVNYFGGEGVTQAFTDFMTTTDGVHYEATIPDAAQTVIFVRHNSSATAPAWDNKWNQTDDQTLTTANCFTITGWDGGTNGNSTGTWSIYTAPVETPTFYITGNDNLVGTDKAWNEKAIQLGKASAETPATYTFTNLVAGDTMKLKVTNGTWDFHFGYTDLDNTCSSENIQTDKDGNIVFVLTTQGDVKLTFDGAKICLTGSFAAPCTDDYGVMVGDAYTAAVINPENTAEYMVLNLNLKQGDTFTMYNNCAKAAWIISNFKENSYKFTTKDEKYVVTETGKYDLYFTLSIEGDAIYVSFTRATPTDNISITLPAEDAPVYNLLGVQVDSNYRGIVIRNGQKFIQK